MERGISRTNNSGEEGWIRDRERAFFCAWPLGFLGMLSLVAGIEMFVSRKADVYVPMTVSIWAYPS